VLGLDDSRLRHLRERRHRDGHAVGHCAAADRRQKRHFIFRTIGRDDQQGPAAAHYIINNVKPKKVAILHDKQSYGQGIASSVKKDLEAAKIPVVLFEGINAGDSTTRRSSRS
jgi:ABC-type branched-subunit amino acid transport system substrate-binding protein